MENLKNLEDLKEELKYLNDTVDNQFDMIGNLYGTMIRAVLNNTITAEDFNTICTVYEMQGGDTWQPETILHKGISISDPENIKPEYLKYLNKPAGNNVKERIENLPIDFFLVSQPFQEFVEHVVVYAHSLDDWLINVSIKSKFQCNHGLQTIVIQYSVYSKICYVLFKDEYNHSEILDCAEKCAAKLENYLNKEE